VCSNLSRRLWYAVRRTPVLFAVCCVFVWCVAAYIALPHYGSPDLLHVMFLEPGGHQTRPARRACVCRQCGVGCVLSLSALMLFVLPHKVCSRTRCRARAFARHCCGACHVLAWWVAGVVVVVWGGLQQKPAFPSVACSKLPTRLALPRWQA